MQWLGQQDFWIANSISNWVVLLLPGKGQLWEGSLIARCVFDVNEVLIVWDAVVFRKLKETDEGLEQWGPEEIQ